MRRPEPRKHVRTPAQQYFMALARRSRRDLPLSKRSGRGQRNQHAPFVPPEDWHEPVEESAGGYRFVIRDPGEGYRHVVTPEEVRQRLDVLPREMVAPLEVVQFSRITRKKRSFPCYGMQWGTAIYLYPIETTLTEYYGRPPKPSNINEARMYGGRWVQESRHCWKLAWTEQAIKDFYLNNILIHELGHLLDDRNSSYIDRERYAEWFAVAHGYKPSRRIQLADKAVKKIVRRHHSR